MLSTYSLKDSMVHKSNFKKEIKDQLLLDSEEKARGSNFNEMSRDNRIDNTLGQLTKNFVELIRSAPDQIIEIDQASDFLRIQKRRIYDITNVLEGIGYIQKLGKNKMKWVGGETGSELEDQAIQLEKEHEAIEMKTKQVQLEIEEMKIKLLALSKENSENNFLRLDDLAKIMRGLKITQMIIYAGGVGDQVENDSNPEKKTSQCTIESNSASTKLYFCKLNDNFQIQVFPNPEEPEQASHRQPRMIVRKASRQQHQRQEFLNFQHPIATQQLSGREDFHLEGLSSLNQDRSLKSHEQFFESDEEK